MKVLHINCNYMGTALHQTMITHLDTLGVENTVFAPVHTLENAVITPNDNVVACKCFHKLDRVLFYRKQRKIEKALQANIDVSEYHLLHAYTLFTDGNCAYELSKQYNIPYVVAVRNTDVNVFFRWMPYLRKRGVEILKNASAVFFLSSAYKEQVLGKYVPQSLREGIEAKSRIIPNGIDDFWLQNLQLTQNKQCHNPIRLVFAGRINANKNIPTIQKAMKLLQEQGHDAQLTVVGKVENKAVFRELVKDKATTYIPPKNKTELIDIYRTNDIFVMPSFTESFGLVYAEAISQGLPVICSAGQGFDGQFPEGEVGYRVDAHSSQSVAEGIIKIVKDYSRITNNLSDKAKRYNWDAICSQYAQIYQAFIKQ